MATSSRPPSSCMRWSLLAPCKRALTRLFRIPTSAAVSIRAFRFRSLSKAAARMSPRRRRPTRRSFHSVRAVFWPLVPRPSASSSATTERGTARSVAAAAAVMEPDTPVHAPMPSPETPAYVKMVTRLRSRTTGAGVVGGEACRSFEGCLMELLAEEGKTRDLQDVEELLQCWERLKSPVFVELVCRFYGELCKDLLSPAGDEGTNTDHRDDRSVPTSAA